METLMYLNVAKGPKLPQIPCHYVHLGVTKIVKYCKL